MQISGIHHHSVLVTDLDRSRAFYRDVLGLAEVPIPPTFHFPVAWFAVGDQQLHLLVAPAPDTLSGRHIALHVDDLAVARARLRGLGLEVSETTPIPGADRFFTHDPDGNRIELISWSRPWGDTVRELGLTPPGRP